MKKTLGIAAMTAFTATAAMASPKIEIITGCTADGKTAHIAAWSEKDGSKQDMENVFKDIIRNYTGEQFQNLDSTFVAAAKDAFRQNGMKGNPAYLSDAPGKPGLTEGCAPSP